MRQVGQLNNELDASVFRDFLFNRGIACDVEPSGNGTWSVWVHDEDRLVEVGDLFNRFRASPDDPFFVKGADGAEEKRSRQDREERSLDRKMKRRAKMDAWFSTAGGGPVTWVLIALSVLISGLIVLDKSDALFRWLMISEYRFVPGRSPFLAEVQSGQLWRLITPVFMHFGILHIIFNMMWLRDLGGMIEQIRGSRYLVLFLVVTAAVSNVAEFYVSGPGFGGMSGVVYGLLGFVWMQSRYNPQSGFLLHPFTVQMMLFWFVICLTGFVGNIANTTHAVGLAAGVLWGYLDARRSAG